MAITYTKLPVTEYDMVIIFDLLSDDERNKHGISEKLEKVFKSRKMPNVKIIKLATKDELIAEIQKYLELAKKGQKFMFHFVAHGNSKCIGFKHTGEEVSWKTLGEILTEINEVTHNTLVLNLTSCFGLNGIKSINFSASKTPFFGLVGYSEKLKIENGIKANEIFYSYILDGNSINEAIHLLQRDLNDKKFLCITSQGYNDIKGKESGKC